MNPLLKAKLKGNISKCFPKIKYSFAYGSAVIPQKGHSGKMIDMFFVVEDLKEFHRENMIRNRDHYSCLAKFSSLSITEKVNKFGSGVYYNPSVKLNDDLFIKYGVVSEQDLLFHLNNWDNLFLPGRFHKPVLSIEVDNAVEESIKRNRESAFSLCVLKSPAKVNKVDFFIDLANLSYIGDFRTYMKAEKKDKIKNVVLGAIDQYLETYKTSIEKYSLKSSGDSFIFNPKDDIHHVKNIPKQFFNSLHIDNNAEEKFAFKLNHETRREIIDNHLKKINFRYSLYGILSGLYSTDLHKSFFYVLEKYKKALNFK